MKHCEQIIIILYNIIMNEYKQKQSSDLSQINQSKLLIRQYEILDLQDQLKKVKYPTFAISNAQSLISKIQSFKEQKIRQSLKKELKGFNSYRKIRGDGNCFFRALAFVCLSSASDSKIQTCFPYLDEICLSCCFPESIPNDFKKFYNYKLLHKMLSFYWTPLYSRFLKQSDQNPRKALVRLFDEYPFLDFIIILYFRAVCLKVLWVNQKQLKQFMVGNQEKLIRHYGKQVEGVLINICIPAFTIRIQIFQVRTGQVKVYQYGSKQKNNKEVYLFFQDHHYDIIQNNQRIEQQNISLTCSKSDYYSDVNKKMIEGECVQCESKCMVYEESYVCKRCFQKISRASRQYQGGKMIRGRCNDCDRYKDTIIQDVGICRRCLDQQNQLEQKRKKKEEQKKKYQKQKNDEQRQKQSMKKSKMDKQSENSKQKQIQKQEQKQKQKKTELPKFIRGKCIQCEFIEDINSQTGICNFCVRKQKMVLDHMESSKKKKQKERDQYSNYPSKQDKYAKQETNDKNKNKDNKYGIGQQIPTKTTVSSVYKRQPSGRKQQRKQDKKQQRKQEKSSNFFSSIQFSSFGSCQKCKEQKKFVSMTPLCDACYRNIFQVQSVCKECKYRSMIHFETRCCKECHYKKYKKVVKKKCINCSVRQVQKDGHCKECTNKYYCRGCKQFKYISMIINGKCYNCRNAYP